MIVTGAGKSVYQNVKVPSVNLVLVSAGQLVVTSL